jgi:hypothetical protein
MFSANRLFAKTRLPADKSTSPQPGCERLPKEDKAAIFTVQLPAGRTTLQAWFYDRDGKQLCGAYYVYVEKVAK